LHNLASLGFGNLIFVSLLNAILVSGPDILIMAISSLFDPVDKGKIVFFKVTLFDHF